MAVEIEWKEHAAWVWLSQPERHNSLTPPMTAALRGAAADIVRANPAAVVLAARGRSFSTGGDLQGFLAHFDSPESVRAYARDVVGGLHEAVLAWLALPMPVIARVQGPVTGGSLGLMLAGDIIVMSEEAFVQPYYAEAGFAPDGGWTALLPERIGAARALEIQLLNRRIPAREALSLGLSDDLASPERLDSVIEEKLETLARHDSETLRQTKRLIRNRAFHARVAAGLEAEKAAFIELVGRDEVRARLAAFMEAMRRSKAVP
jgi:2-(1,2-epoxy-1,2-dihydrophenyl)acetyl-CoA isomerase